MTETMPMRAALTTAYGPPEVLAVGQVDAPIPREDEVLVEVHASPVSAGDRRLRSADFPSFTAPIGRAMFGFWRPRRAIQGTAFAGRVVQVGARVSRFSVDDDVFGTVEQGAYAERVAVSERGVIARMPEATSYEEAACLPYGAISAQYFLERARLAAGERILILGASGGVGRFAVQLAHARGAVVTGVCSAKSASLVRSLGAHEVLDYAREVPRAASYDVVFDIAGVSGFSEARAWLRPGGRFVTLHVSFGVLAAMLLSPAFGSKRAYAGVALGSQAELEDVRRLAESGVLTPHVARTYELDAIRDAHREAERRPNGDVVVRIKAP